MNDPHRSAVETLDAWRREMPRQVRLVFDHDNAYDTIIEAVRSTEGAWDVEDAAIQQLYASRLADLASSVNSLRDKVPSWTGPSAEAFDSYVGSLRDKVSTLATMGSQGDSLLNTAAVGARAKDEVVLDLVKSSVDFATRSLGVANALSELTGGTSVANWSVVNIQQVSRLVEEVTEAGGRVDNLLGYISGLFVQLADAIADLGDHLASLQVDLED